MVDAPQLEIDGESRRYVAKVQHDDLARERVNTREPRARRRWGGVQAERERRIGR